MYQFFSEHSVQQQDSDNQSPVGRFSSTGRLCDVTANQPEFGWKWRTALLFTLHPSQDFMQDQNFQVYELAYCFSSCLRNKLRYKDRNKHDRLLLTKLQLQLNL